MSATKPLNDLLIISENQEHKIGPKGGEAFLRSVMVAKQLRIVAEAVAEEWVELTFVPEVASHELFMLGAAPEEAQFVQATMRFGLKPAPLPFGEGPETNFFLLIQGTPHSDVLGRFKNKFREILLARPATFVQPHGELHQLPEVPEDEKPRTRDKRERGTAKAGTRVEEW
mgnify:FL=1